MNISMTSPWRRVRRGLQRLQQTLTEHLADPKLRSVIFEAVKGCNKHGTRVDFTRCISENYRKLGFEMEKPNILTIKGGERTRRNWKNTR